MIPTFRTMEEIARDLAPYARAENVQWLHLDDALRLRAARAIYAPCNVWGEVLYVGSVCRPTLERAVGRRLREHTQDGKRTNAWRSMWVIPLINEPATSVVRELEGRVGYRLLPAAEQRLPRATWAPLTRAS